MRTSEIMMDAARAKWAAHLEAEAKGLKAEANGLWRESLAIAAAATREKMAGN